MTVSFPRQVGRVGAFIIGAHMSITGVLFLYSRIGKDPFHESHWHHSKTVATHRSNYWRFWEASFYHSVLSPAERKCLDAWLRVMALHTPPLAGSEMSPRIVTQDSLAFLDGLNELRDGVYTLQCCMCKVTPYVLEVRREYQSETTFLHCKVESDVEVRIPYTKRTVFVGTLPSSVTLQLGHPSYNKGKLVVNAVEHRWFGGPIFSQQTASMRSPWGDIGDLCRRYNGFMLSAMVTKKISVASRLDAVRETVKKMDKELREEQERQIEM